MRITRSLLAAMGGLVMAGFGSTAMAGGCGAATACNPGVNVTNSPYVTQPMGLNYAQPYDYLKRVSYNQTPQINVMRVETGPQMAALSQAPGAYWGGCGNDVTCGSMAAPAPVMQAPVYSAPVMAAPVAAAPRSYVGGGYNPANFASRQYGDNTFVPGIVHAPTSYVERSPVARDQALMSGRAVSQPVVSSYSSGSYATSSYSTTSSVGGGWEKVSGPTMIDGMLATEILCKTEPTVTTQSYQVVRPIVGVPYPVPTMVNNNCAAPVAPQKPVQAAGGRYGNTWSY